MNEKIEAKVTHRFVASPERVYDALLDPSLVRRWQQAWLDRAGTGGEVSASEIDPQVGGTFLFADRCHDAETRNWGSFLELDKPTKIAFTWIAEPEEAGDPSVVTIIIEPEPDGWGSIVTLYNTMDARWSDGLAQTEKAWMAMLEGVGDVIEPGRTA